MLRSILAIITFSLSTSLADEPNAIYLHEGFNGGGIPAGWTQFRITGIQAAWSVVGTGSNPPIPPYAGAGQVKFNSFDAGVGEQARLVSPSLNLTNATDPYLTFFMYHEDEYLSSFDSVYVEASTADSISGPWTRLLGVQRPQTASGWSRKTVSLFSYVGMNRLFISLRGVSKYGNNILIDEVRVADTTFHDLELTTLLPENTPTTDQHGSATSTRSRFDSHGKRSDEISTITISRTSQLLIRAIVRNLGTFAESAYMIGWDVDGQQQSPVNGGAIAARTGLDTAVLVWNSPSPGLHTMTAWTVLGSDPNRSNDTARITFHVLEAGTFFVELFNGPAFPPANWIVINRDGGQLAPWFAGGDTSAFVPFDGSGFAANNFQRAFGTYLDDYLITPPIAGIGQPGMVDSLVFRARSQFNQPPAVNFPDSLMVLLSITGADTSNFTIPIDYFDVPKTGWTRKSYSISNRVPANSTVRVAFRYLLYNVQASGGSGDFLGIDAVQLIRSLPASAERIGTKADGFSLAQNFPNPFNPTTTIRYALAQPSAVSLMIYNVFGQEIARLVDTHRESGVHSVDWDGRNRSGDQVATGVYFYMLVASPTHGGAPFRTVKKMIMMK